jgi:hypothetical protein
MEINDGGRTRTAAASPETNRIHVRVVDVGMTFEIGTEVHILRNDGTGRSRIAQISKQLLAASPGPERRERGDSIGPVALNACSGPSRR